jgi:hypothetical protein
MAVAHHVEKRDQNMKSSTERAAVLAKPLDHVGALLRHDHRRLGDHDDDQQRQHDDNNKSAHRVLLIAFGMYEQH